MPYINKKERVGFENLVLTMHESSINSAGELNYLLTQLVYAFLDQKPNNYQSYNDALGAIEGCKMELYRRTISKYEDVKINENGDVP